MDEAATPPELTARLVAWAGSDPLRHDVATTVIALARACTDIAALIASGPLAGALGASRGRDNGGGDEQKELDVRCDDLIRAALAAAPVAALASEEADHAVTLDPAGTILVAVDPLDGSSNIDTDVSVGTIFSILRRAGTTDPLDDAAFLRPGREQLAAGYVVYGPHVALVLSVGEGVDEYILDTKRGGFFLVKAGVRVPREAREFAINMSNYRHWDDSVRAYVDDLIAGRDGPRAADYNMRWSASMIAEAHRIFVRGGIYLYPGDVRAGYACGRLRLVYEAAPVGFLMDQAGGRASDGATSVLDVVPEELHQRIPLIFGSRAKVERVERYLSAGWGRSERSPLFSKRGLLTA
ncbi:MAG: class 1 fructose-bisphosphatase [Phyllobacteriaceae bacterium]|nr:class 1 fructose-bisphosphatase [Phyllobacteriaceae bacterium]